MNKPFQTSTKSRNGVMPSVVSVSQNSGLLLDFLIQRFPHINRTIWLSRMHQGQITNQNGEIMHPNSKCIAGSKILYFREVINENPVPFKENILWTNEHLFVVDKPHFLPVTPSGGFLRETLLFRLHQSTGIEQLSPIHRLDKDTAGVILFSAQTHTRDAYQALFRHQKVQKTYHAIAPTRLDLNYPLTYKSRLIEDAQYFFRTAEATGEPNSSTKITLLENRGRYSLYQLEPHTGKKHQLRVHMNALNMPILNDSLYPNAYPTDQIDYSKPLQLLAKQIEFIDPITGQLYSFTSPQQL